ncbi:hypothetical protein GGR56DRAFT_310292 [Xylariaceae sp. FL0804]|nr:hypothetical protein GGR56DRAFT_310292 [Xylariaceae sp. FL0804]
MAMEEVRAAVAAAPGDAAAEASGASGESLSCVTCRNRKLKCDRVRPVCTRCARVRGECVYPESRRKPAVKRRNVKELEARLAQVEGLLKDVGAGEGRPAAAAAAGQQEAPADEADEAAEVAADFDSLEVPMTDDVMFQGLDYAPYGIASFDVANDPAGSTAPPGQMPGDNAFQLMDLGGMFEALPPFEVMEEL